MQTASSYNMPAGASGSKPIVKGDSLNFELSFLNSNIMHMLDNAVSEVLEDVRQRVITAAEQDPQWSEFKDIISVTWEDGDIVVGLDGDDDTVQRALAVEYGTPEMRPNPLLRKFSISKDSAHSKQLTDTINRKVSFG